MLAAWVAPRARFDAFRHIIFLLSMVYLSFVLSVSSGTAHTLFTLHSAIELPEVNVVILPKSCLTWKPGEFESSDARKGIDLVSETGERENLVFMSSEPELSGMVSPIVGAQG